MVGLVRTLLRVLPLYGRVVVRVHAGREGVLLWLPVCLAVVLCTPVVHAGLVLHAHPDVALILEVGLGLRVVELV